MNSFGDQFNPRQRAEAIALLERMAWGSMDDAISDVEICFRRLLEGTSADLRRWENDLGPAAGEEGWDEFTLPDGAIREMPAEEKLAYVARLLESLALAYGTHYDGGTRRYRELAGEAPTAPATLLHGLNDLLWIPTAEPSSSLKGRP